MEFESTTRFRKSWTISTRLLEGLLASITTLVTGVAEREAWASNPREAPFLVDKNPSSESLTCARPFPMANIFHCQRTVTKHNRKSFQGGDPNSALSFEYKVLGDEVSESTAGTSGEPTVVLTSTFNGFGDRTSVSATINGIADFKNEYLYNGDAEMTRVTQSGTAGGNAVAPKRVDLAYRTDGASDTITRYSDLTVTQVVATPSYGYDTAGRLTSLTHSTASGSTIAPYTWTYDTSSRLATATSVDGTVTYSYDLTGQLTSATGATAGNETFTYDANGNRTIAGYVNGGNNELLSDGTYTYTYDGEGNRTRRTEIATGNYLEYAWDYHNRLTDVTYHDADGTTTKTVHYTYDAEDRLIGKEVDDTGTGTFDHTERYVYDGEQMVLRFDGAGSLTNRYLSGPEVDQVFADEDALGQVLWSLGDNQGTIRDVVDNSGVVQDHLTYSAFGAITSQTNAAAQPEFTYTGRVWDADSQLYQYRARWLDPITGGFVSEDPTGFDAGDSNLGRYVSNGPTNSTDPSGLRERSDRSREATRAAINDTWTMRYIHSAQDAYDENILNTVFSRYNVLFLTGATFVGTFVNVGPTAVMSSFDTARVVLDEEASNSNTPVKNAILKTGYYATYPMEATSYSALMLSGGALGGPVVTATPIIGPALSSPIGQRAVTTGLTLLTADRLISDMQNGEFEVTHVVDFGLSSSATAHAYDVKWRDIRSLMSGYQIQFDPATANMSGLGGFQIKFQPHNELGASSSIISSPAQAPASGADWYKLFQAKYGANNVEWSSLSNTTRSSVGSVLHPNVPVYPGSGPATGVFRFGEAEVPLQAGAEGPGASLRSLRAGGPGSGLNAAIPTHVEGHVSGIMHEFAVTEGDLFINLPPCQTSAMCRHNLQRILPNGSSLRVHFLESDGKVTSWLFQQGTPGWTPLP